jgi:hypothetical protein
MNEIEIFQKQIVARVQVRVVINYNNFVFQMTTRRANTSQVCTRRQSSGGATSGIRHDIGRVKEIGYRHKLWGGGIVQCGWGFTGPGGRGSPEFFFLLKIEIS